MEQRLMSALEVKEKDLNKLKAKVDSLLKSDHPASDKIEVWTDPFINCIFSEISGQYTVFEYKRGSLISYLSPIYLLFLPLCRLTETLCRLSGVGSCRLPSALKFI